MLGRMEIAALVAALLLLVAKGELMGISLPDYSHSGVFHLSSSLAGFNCSCKANKVLLRKMGNWAVAIQHVMD